MEPVSASVLAGMASQIAPKLPGISQLLPSQKDAMSSSASQQLRDNISRAVNDSYTSGTGSTSGYINNFNASKGPNWTMIALIAVGGILLLKFV